MALPSTALELARKDYARRVLAPIDDERFVHEPRALWTVQQLRAAASAASVSTACVICPKDHFRNVTDYPMTLTKLLVSGINYAYRSFNPVAGNVAANQIHNAASAMNHIKVFISAPYSRHFTKRVFTLASQAALPTGSPGMMYSRTPYASDLWGVSRWRFDRPYRLPRKATIQLDLSGWNCSGINGGVGIFNDIFSSVLIEEATTGRFYGDMRIRDRSRLDGLRTQSNGSTFYPSVTDIFPPDNLGNINTGNAVPGTWPASGVFLPRVFNKQETSRGQEWSSFTGFAVLLDQIDFDEGIQAQAAPWSGNQLSPMALKVGVRARTTNGGTNQWWWRDGAPLALVCPTQTPALVFNFDQPIVLGPGDELEVELEAPIGQSVVVAGSGGPQLIRPFYNIGVSMTGYATVG